MTQTVELTGLSVREVLEERITAVERKEQEGQKVVHPIEAQDFILDTYGAIMGQVDGLPEPLRAAMQSARSPVLRHYSLSELRRAHQESLRTLPE